MFSEELTTYLYSYNMPQKEEETKSITKKEYKVEMPIINILQKAYLTSPVNLHHEQK